MRTTVLIAGAGGQGVLLAGKVLAEAALSENMNVTWYPSYGAAMRGGPANCTVIISDNPIGSPVVSKFDVLIVLSRMSLSSFEDRLQAGGLLVMDSSNIKACPGRDDLSLVDVPVRSLGPAIELQKLSNIVLVGAFVAKTGVLRQDSMDGAIRKVSLKETEANLMAFNLGKEFIKEH